MLGSEHLHSLVDVVVSYLDGCQDQKLLELGLMVLDNLLRTNLHFKVETWQVTAAWSNILFVGSGNPAGLH